MHETPSDLPRPLRHYVIVCEDLPLGQKFAQLLHAAGESAVVAAPPDSNTVAVALEAPRADLVELIADLRSRDIPLVEVVETEGEFAGQLMAIGIAPTRDNRVRKLTYHFKQCGSVPPE